MNKSILVFLISTAIVFSFGVIMVFNTTSAEVLNKSLEVSTHSGLIKQLIYAFIGLSLGVCVFIIGYEKILKMSPLLLGLCVLTLILVFVPKIGQSINGAKRWIGFAKYTIQPSEFAKYIIPMFFIYKKTETYSIDFVTFIKILTILSIPILLILLEPDTGSTIIILTTFIAVFFLTRIKVLYWGVPLLVLFLVGATLAYNMNHVRNRITVYMHPERDIKGKGHQPYQAKIAVGSGKFMGRGLGESLQKLDYLPEARNDYIAAIYAEETGFLGISVLVALYLSMAVSGFYIASKSIDKRGFYLASLITFLISFQAFLNLGVVSNLLPSKGVTLPFFSQGGTSLIVNIIGVSLLISIAAKNRKKWENIKEKS